MKYKIKNDGMSPKVFQTINGEKIVEAGSEQTLELVRGIDTNIVNKLKERKIFVSPVKEEKPNKDK